NRNPDEIRDSKNGECPHHTDADDQSACDRSGDQRSSAKSRDRNSGNHSTTIREPFDQGCNRNYVAKAKTNSGEQAIRKIQPVQMASRKAGEENASSIKNAGGERDPPRTGAAHPQTSKKRRKAQREDGDREG